MNKKYHVYGIGNALVDIDIQISDDKLKALNIEKGVMTLIDENRHQELLDKIDGMEQVHSCGGSAANTLIAVSQLGGNGFYSCKVAHDTCGDIFVNDLHAHGLDSNFKTLSRKHGVTGKCLVLVTPDAERTMNTFLGITETFSVNELNEKAIANSEYLYIEGYLATSQTGRLAAIKAKEIAENNNVKTSITLSDPNMTRFFSENLHEMIGHGVDVLFCNHEEALIFAKTNDLTHAIDYLKNYATKLCITLGAKGALYIDGQSKNEVKGFSIDAIDTVGAGDMFAGSFLYAITHGVQETDAVKFANYCSAQVVAKYGPRLNDKTIQNIKANFCQTVDYSF
jgi:sugar/nucleoside kinase (ribokinase family)